MRVVVWLLVTGYWLLSAMPVCAQEKPRPIWPTYGLEINNTPGNTPQQNPKIISTKYGYYLAVWEDRRNGFANLYAQKIDENGALLLGKDGIPVARSVGNQNYPNLIEDTTGGAIVVWQDHRNGNIDIYAQHLGPQGELLWGSEGIPVCKAPAGQFAPELAPDGAGGAIVTWHDYRSGTGEDVYAQRLDKDGHTLWEENGIPLCTESGTQWYPRIASDGASGAIIAWTDGRISSADNNIYGQRIDPAGKALWEKGGIPICSAPSNQEHPTIIEAEGGAVIAWNDSRNGNLDIYAQKIAPNGNLLWEKDGAAVSTAAFAQENPKLATDGAGGAIIAWTDSQREESNIYVQRIKKDGQADWGENGRAVAKILAKQENPEIANPTIVGKLLADEWIITWEDYRKGFPLLFAQKINRSGIPLWQEGGVLLSQGQNAQEKPSLAVSSNGEIVAVWQDRRNGNYDIYAQKLSTQGRQQLLPTLLWGNSGLVICQTTGAVAHQNANLIKGGRGEAIIVFEDQRSGYSNIYAQKISPAGKFLWGKDGIAVAKVKANQTNPQLVSDGAGGVIVAWEDSRIPNLPKIFAQRIDTAGRKVWENGSVTLSKINARQGRPLVVPDKAGGAIVIWEDERNPLSLKDLYAQRISGKGELLWNKNGIPLSSENGEQGDAAMIPDGMGGALVAWTDYRSGERNPDIYAQRIDNHGKLLWKEEGIPVCGAPDVQRGPKISSDGEGGALVVWTDKGGGSYDIYAQRLTSQGQSLWLKDGIPINQLGRTQQNPIFGTPQIILWEDYRYGNWDIFAGAVSPQGKVLWGEGGIPVSSLPHTQYAPQAIPWKDGGAIITWEDYRSGKQYEVYIQKITGKGRPAWAENGVLVKTSDGARSPKLLGQPGENSFVIVWEDYTGGGKAIYGQRFTTD